MNTTTHVDVLAAFRLAMDVCNDDITDTCEVADVFEKLRQARAAVAELMERERALAEALRYVMACVGDSPMIEHAAREAANALLAQRKGGAA